MSTDVPAGEVPQFDWREIDRREGNHSTDDPARHE
jgi:hypothetical protein